jgi:hypothetical protein
VHIHIIAACLGDGREAFPPNRLTTSLLQDELHHRKNRYHKRHRKERAGNDKATGFAVFEIVLAMLAVA